jgi:2-oxoglutarate dehydrogenase E1 component
MCLSGKRGKLPMELEKIIGTGLNSIEALEHMYEQYKANPQSVDPSWKSVFSLEPESFSSRPSAKEDGDARIAELIHAYRMYGHLAADINPLAEKASSVPPQLNIENYGLSAANLDQKFSTFGLLPHPEASLREIIHTLKSIYCGKVGIEFVDICPSDIAHWLEERIEPKGFVPDLSSEQRKMILEYLNKSEIFESFIHMKYPGQKRFSLEGAEALIPMLAEIIDRGAEHGFEEFIIGMAHRGRLNVLSNILNKSYAKIFSEFAEGYMPDPFEGSGDVKYHKGYYSNTVS